MKPFLKVLTFLCLLPILSSAQGGRQDVVHWDFSVIRKSSNTWTLKAKATMDKGYHIWALDAGGDGSLIPTAIAVEEPDELTWEGEWKEIRKPREQTYEFIEGKVFFFEGSATFTRDFKAEKGITLTGSAEYQTCNEQMCYPPTSAEFSLEVK